MPTTRLFRTSTFQIAVLYLVLFCTTLTGVLAYIYWSTSKLIERELDDTIKAEIRGLSEQYRDEGLARLVEVIQERSRRSTNTGIVYLLTDPSSRPLAGNLSGWPDGLEISNDWAEVPMHRVEDPSDTTHMIRARLFRLQNGFRLMVGSDSTGRTDFRRIMEEGIAWALLPVVLLGLSGGIVVGRYALHRVDAVAATSSDIIKGDLTRRVPLSGSGDEFDRLAHTINEMLEQIDMLMTSMRAVTDSLAHDLRSPLTRAKGGIELALRKDSDNETYRQVLAQTNAELDTILRTFEALINIAAAEAGVNRQNMEALDLSNLTSDMFEMFQPMAEDKNIEMTGEIMPNLTVSGNRQLLGQMMANLLDNAIKFTPAGGRIEVSLAQAPEGPILHFADSGPGIPAEDRDRVLKRFVRLDSSRATPGSGLGFSLVAAVARLHDARLVLGDNEPGLTVSLAFPGR